MGQRGQYTEEVKALCLKVFGDELSVRGLRLLPHIMQCAMDSRPLTNITPEERALVVEWTKRGWLLGGGAQPCRMSRAFYDAVCEVLWVAYANCEV